MIRKRKLFHKHVQPPDKAKAKADKSFSSLIRPLSKINYTSDYILDLVSLNCVSVIITITENVNELVQITLVANVHENRTRSINITPRTLILYDSNIYRVTNLRRTAHIRADQSSRYTRFEQNPAARVENIMVEITAEAVIDDLLLSGCGG